MVLGWEAKNLIQELFHLISVGRQVWLAVQGAKSFKEECGELGKRVNRLSQMLKTLISFISTAPTSLYLRPVNIIVSKVRDNFQLAQAILYKCNRRSLLSRLFSSRNATRFRELLLRLNDSISHMQWLIMVYNPQNSRTKLPIDYKMSITFLVWYCIAIVQMGRRLEDRVHAAECLRLLAQSSNEYKQIIIEEGGVSPLQKLLKENLPLETQITTAKALCLLCDDQEKTKITMKEMITTILNRLSRTSPMTDQTKAANLVASIAEHNPELKEYTIVAENVVWRLVTLLSSEPSRDNPRTKLLHHQLKISCSKALWVLSRDNDLVCTTLAETTGMFCLAKLMGTEQGELQYNCLMIIREITATAESNAGFRHLAFKSSSPAAMAVVDELLKIIEEFDDTRLRIPAIKSISSLARFFSAKETRVISPLVAQLDNTDQLEVAMEAAIALKKFVDSDNHLRSEHSKSIVKFSGVELLMKLFYSGDKKLQHHGSELICYLAEHDSHINVPIEAGELPAEHQQLKEVVSGATSKLESNQNIDENEEFDSSTKSSTKQIITEQSKVVSNSLLHHLKLLFEVITFYLPRLVKFHVVGKTLPIIARCKRRFVHKLRCLKIWRIKPFLKAKCLELAQGLVMLLMYYQVEMLAKEIVQKLRLRQSFVNSFKKKKKPIENQVLYLISLAERIVQAVDQAKFFRPNCMEMGKQVYRLPQMLRTLLYLITLNPLSPYLDPIHCVISEVSWTLQEALALACECRRKTIFCRLFFTGTRTSSHFHKLYHLLDLCIANMNWLILIYNPDFCSAFNEIFLSLPRILTNDSSIPLAWSCMVTEYKIWELAILLRSETSPLINSRMIKEIETLMLCLAKLVEEEHVEIQCCLMTIVEITAAAESNLDLRCKAFKTNSPGAKAILQQLPRVIQKSEDPKLQLRNGHHEVATEAVVALQKFACKDNYLHKAHSKRMIEFNAIQDLVKLLRDDERTQQLHVLVLICYIATNADYSEDMEQARLVTAIQQLLDRKRGRRRVVSLNPELKQLVLEALYYLTLYYKD
ncbi:hypothetical protein PTKIN_Ptkin02bG0243200 [Pterospermum kingtungense]